MTERTSPPNTSLISDCDPAYEEYFLEYRNNIVGANHTILTPYGEKRLTYANWVTSGRLYRPIEQIMMHKVGPMVDNTYAQFCATGRVMNEAYEYAHELIKKHVHAAKEDVILTTGTGLSEAVPTLIRLLGLRIPDAGYQPSELPEQDRPVVFITNTENPFSRIHWQNSVAEVVDLECDEMHPVKPEVLEHKLEQYKDRPLKIGSFTACPVRTGEMTSCHRLARIMHEYGGICIVDFTTSAPYTDIKMYSEITSEERLDAIYFAPNRFLGGPGSSDILIFNRSLNHLRFPGPGRSESKKDAFSPLPDGRDYLEETDARINRTSSCILQTIRAAMSIRLKEKIGVRAMQKRLECMMKLVYNGLSQIGGLDMLTDGTVSHFGILSFNIEHIHPNLVVNLLSDRFGIQAQSSEAFEVRNGDRRQEGTDVSGTQGWVCLSLHPTMSDFEVAFIASAIRELTEYIDQWQKDYCYKPATNEFFHKNHGQYAISAKEWFWI